MGKYDEWIKSTEAWPAFVDFAYRGLRPIWELCTDESRKGELKEAYEVYASDPSRLLDPTMRFPLQNGDKIALQAHNDQFLGHTMDENLLIMPTLEDIYPNAEVTVKVLEDGRITLLADNGKYWGSTNYQGRTILAANQWNPPDGHSSYKVTYFKDGRIALQVSDDKGHYLRPSQVPLDEGSRMIIEYVPPVPDEQPTSSEKFSVHSL
jgi:hypothetical protein